MNKHGQHMTPLYWVYSAMIQRCENPNNKYYHRYGGRGITICPEWRTDFCQFKAWADSAGYTRGLYLDCEDNSLGYNPDNCQWVTPKQSTRNRDSVKLTAQDAQDIRAARSQGIPYSQLSKKYGVRQGTLTYIMSGRNWALDDGRPYIRESR